MIKRLFSMVSAILVSISSLFVFAPMIAHAAADACTWTGGGADANWSTTGNWSCATDTGEAPAAGDSLVFPYGASAARFASNNDLTAGTSFTSITFSGTKGGGDSNYVLSGNGITLTTGITDSSLSAYDTQINLPVTAGDDLTISGSVRFGSYDVTDKTIALGSHDLTFSGYGGGNFYGPVTGSGNITAATGGLSFSGDSPDYTGTVTGSSYIYINQGAFGGSVVVNNSGVLYVYICEGQTRSLNITMNATAGTGDSNLSINSTTCPPPTGGGMGGGGGGCEDALVFIPCAVTPDEYFSANSMPINGSATLDGTLTLGADVVLSSWTKNIAIKSAISGNYNIGLLEGGNASLTLQGSSNTSKTANATINPIRRAKTIAAGDESTAIVSVSGYTSYTVNGKRGDTYVSSGAVLKGSGTVGKLKVDDESFVAPGNSPGCLNSNDFTLQGTYDFELGGVDPCTGYDQLKVTGAVNLTDGSVSVSTYNNYKAKAGSKYVLVANDGTDAITGTLKGVAEGATFKSNGYVLRASYKGGDGNDLQLAVVSIPGTPNTGLSLITNNPTATLVGATVAAGAILIMSRRMKPATKRARR